MSENITNKLVKLDIAIEELSGLINVLVSGITGTSDLEACDLMAFSEVLKNKMQNVTSANDELSAKFFGTSD